jgi:hypothetical protein
MSFVQRRGSFIKEIYHGFPFRAKASTLYLISSDISDHDSTKEKRVTGKKIVWDNFVIYYLISQQNSMIHLTASR